MKEIYIDIETYSSVDLSKCSVYKYAESDDFEILLFAYAVDDSEVKIVDLAKGEEIPSNIIKALEDTSIIKWAHNVQFERVCLSKMIHGKGKYINPESWKCSMVLSLYNGFPRSLKDVGAAINITDRKLDEGKDLVKYFCIPCKPTKVNGNRTRNYYYHDRNKWEMFKKYNIRDVEAEIQIINKLRKFDAPDFVWKEFYIDQSINDTGVLIDSVMVQNCLNINEEITSELNEEMQELTSLKNPNSVSQQKDWLEAKGLYVETLGKKQVKELSKKYENTDIGKMMELRKMLSKSSIKKYLAMLNAKCSDGRVRGMFMFYGAKTGRWSSKIVQLQNLPRNEMNQLDIARNLAILGDTLALKLLFEDVPDTLSQLVRTAFVAPNDKKFIVADFSAIEARVLAWLSGESWRQEAFKNNKDIYCESASQMFKVPVVKHGINGHLRQKGKIAELALGYGGSVGALEAMGAYDMGLTKKELPDLVSSWRKANTRITDFWWNVDKAIRVVIKKKKEITYKSLRFVYQSALLFIYLPSGRRLTYVKPRLEERENGEYSITYLGLTMAKKFERIESYGPKFVENIVQAISRDLLMNSIKNLQDYKIVMHIHDEVVVEVDKSVDVSTICSIMGEIPSWAEGLVLRADGYETEYYKKD